MRTLFKTLSLLISFVTTSAPAMADSQSFEQQAGAAHPLVTIEIAYPSDGRIYGNGANIAALLEGSVKLYMGSQLKWIDLEVFDRSDEEVCGLDNKIEVGPFPWYQTTKYRVFEILRCDLEDGEYRLDANIFPHLSHGAPDYTDSVFFEVKEGVIVVTVGPPVLVE